MSGSSIRPRSDNPYAELYIAEKANFSGILVGAILYGVIIILFFRCMATLLNPVKRTKGDITWWLVIHTVLMFSFVTIILAINFYLQPISYVDNRKFPGDHVFAPGPFAYQGFIGSEALSNIPFILTQLNQLLADGLLLYRCYIIYGMNYWVVAFPCLMYLASFATGIAYSIVCFRPKEDYQQNQIIEENFITANFSMSLALNVFLTIAIIGRLILHNRDFHKAIGAQATASGSYRGIVAMLSESFALYSVTLLVFIVPTAMNSPISNSLIPILPMTQVIAPFLIVLRVATRKALKSDDITSGKVGSIRFRSHGESTSRDGTVPDGDFIDSTDASGEIASKTGTGNGETVEEVPR